MTKTLLYSQGYLIRVNSWENDADNFRTEEVQEPNKEKAKALVNLAKLFERSQPLSNQYERPSNSAEILVPFYKENKILFTEEELKEIEADDDEDDSLVVDWLYDMASNLGLTGGEFANRVARKVEVFYFDSDVYVEEVTL